LPWRTDPVFVRVIPSLSPVLWSDHNDAFVKVYYKSFADNMNQIQLIIYTVILRSKLTSSQDPALLPQRAGEHPCRIVGRITSLIKLAALAASRARREVMKPI
jgi:hypothetical protein